MSARDCIILIARRARFCIKAATFAGAAISAAWCAALASAPAAASGLHAEALARNPAFASTLEQTAEGDDAVQPSASLSLADAEAAPGGSAERFAIFTPAPDRTPHRIDYEIWDFALKQLVVSMGPSIRKRPLELGGPTATRIRLGHDSFFRVEGSMFLFSQLDKRAIASFTEYREDLENIAGTIELTRLPRNEQLAFWFNLHNVALVEQIAKNWPMRQPRTFEIDGVPLHDAPIITIRGVTMSLRDIRENIVFANWTDPRVLYGFWRGELGGPALEPVAFTGPNVDGVLTMAAEDFVNSLRGTQKRGSTLHVSTLYDEARRFFFPDFEADLRAHLTQFANEEVRDLIDRTDRIEASVHEWDIADMAGGRRDAIWHQFARPSLPQGAIEILEQRRRKWRRLRQKGIPTGRVYFTQVLLPGQDPESLAVK